MRILFPAALALAATLLPAPALAQPATPLAAEAVVTAGTGEATGIKVRLTLNNSSDTSASLSLGRSSKQGCAFGPALRVLAVGSREVVYPAPQGEPLICTQELRSQTVPAGGQAVLERTVPLPPGEYMVEIWLQGFLGPDGTPTKLVAKPQRITVK